jgi:zinc transporter ZupT
LAEFLLATTYRVNKTTKMKKIIAGQIMMWSNLVGVTVGYALYKTTGIDSEYLGGLLGFLGVSGSVFNLVISIMLQISGYREGKILSILE